MDRSCPQKIEAVARTHMVRETTPRCRHRKDGMLEVQVLSWGIGRSNTRGKAEREYGWGIVGDLRMAARESTEKWEETVGIGSYFLPNQLVGPRWS